MLTTDDLDTILTALHERRNRLIHIDMDGKANPPAVPTLRSRINECTDTIRKIKHMKGAA